MHKPFRPLTAASNPHLQTLLPRRVHHPVLLKPYWQRLELADGDFVDLSWSEDPPLNVAGIPYPILALSFFGTDNVIIPWQDIEQDTLSNLIESFVLREGTDYGEHERSLEQKVDDVRRQLKNGDVVLVWSELHETINIMPRKQVPTSR